MYTNTYTKILCAFIFLSHFLSYQTKHIAELLQGMYIYECPKQIICLFFLIFSATKQNLYKTTKKIKLLEQAVARKWHSN